MANKTRTTFEIWLPFGLMLLLGAASWATMWLILAWLAIGVGVLSAQRNRGPLASYGREAYRTGFRSLILKTLPCILVAELSTGTQVTRVQGKHNE